MSHRARARWVIGAAAVGLSATGLVEGIASAAQAVIGESAPTFSLSDTEGQPRSLEGVKGSVVVLEWSNHECPFVRKHYGSGNMQRLQATYTERGVVWLTMVSSAPGKQGHVTAQEANAIRRQRGDHQTAMLLDSEGTVGQRYGAKTTPHMFVIDPAGTLVYAGAIDDAPSTDPADVVTAQNYVARALEDAMNGNPVSIAETKPYGCSVKY